MGWGDEKREPDVPTRKPRHFLFGVIPIKHVRQSHSVRQRKKWGEEKKNQLVFIFIDVL